MYYRYAVYKESDVCDEVPWEKREWWRLASTHTSKQEALEWHNEHKRHQYTYKLIYSDRTLSDSFFPRIEIKRRTETAKMLQNLKYGV